MLYPAELQAQIGRGRGIRTPDILLPKQARYQTALYPELNLLEGRILIPPSTKKRNDTVFIKNRQALFQ